MAMSSHFKILGPHRSLAGKWSSNEFLSDCWAAQNCQLLFQLYNNYSTRKKKSIDKDFWVAEEGSSAWSFRVGEGNFLIYCKSLLVQGQWIEGWEWWRCGKNTCSQLKILYRVWVWRETGCKVARIFQTIVDSKNPALLGFVFLAGTNSATQLSLELRCTVLTERLPTTAFCSSGMNQWSTYFCSLWRLQDVINFLLKIQLPEHRGQMG